MPEFILDKSGIVLGQPAPWEGGGLKADGAWTFGALSPIVRGYIEAMFFTECDPSINKDEVEQGHEYIDGSIPSDVGFSDLHPDALAAIIRDCGAFHVQGRDLIREADGKGDYAKPEYDTGEQVGHDFWMTRNGHGVGFWDRGLGEIGDKLSAVAREFGEPQVWFADHVTHGQAPFVYHE